jgi:hypothetical protein
LWYNKKEGVFNMNKKKLAKKLALNKEKIAGLNPADMKKIKGASILGDCTFSCSVFVACCEPITQPPFCKTVEKMAG